MENGDDNNNNNNTARTLLQSSETTTTTSLWWQFWNRIAQGPEALQPLDKILFGVVILLAFELLDFLTKSSGSTYL